VPLPGSTVEVQLRAKDGKVYDLYKGKTGDEQDKERPERKREPRGGTRARKHEHAQDEDDAEHDGKGDDLCGDDRERHELAWEAHLANQARVLDQAARRGLQRGRKEHPRR
jgi:hypothetical protein